MKKTRITIILTAAGLSALLLFGGWTAYERTAVAAPIEQVISELPAITDYKKPVRNQDLVKIELTLANDANVREIYHAIQTQASTAIGDRELELDIQDTKDELLESVWQSALFAIAEAMETKAYSEIPAIMDKAAADYEHVSVTSEIDEHNVYITLKHEQAAKHIVLPRVPAQLEVWNNA